MKAVLIYNPAAGRQKRLRPEKVRQAREVLEGAGFTVAVEPITEAKGGSQLAREAVEAGAGLIVVCGGDGTINKVVAGMVHSSIPLAILPGGTANVLARELGLPLDIVAAARQIPVSTPRRLAVGCANGQHFLSMAGVGFDARVVKAIDPRWKALFGMGSYVMEAMRQLFLGPPNPLFAISSNGKCYTATFACISRAQYYGPVRAVPEAGLFLDQFHVYCFHSQSRLRYLVYALSILAGRHQKMREFSQFPARSVRCEAINSSRSDTSLQVDGELAGQLPCTIELVPDALTVLVPRIHRGGTTSCV